MNKIYYSLIVIMLLISSCGTDDVKQKPESKEQAVVETQDLHAEFMEYLKHDLLGYRPAEITRDAELIPCNGVNAMIITKQDGEFNVNGTKTSNLKAYLLKKFRANKRATKRLNLPNYYFLNKDQIEEEVLLWENKMEKIENSETASASQIEQVYDKFLIRLERSKALDKVMKEAMLFLNEDFHIHIQSDDPEIRQIILEVFSELRDNASKQFFEFSYEELYGLSQSKTSSEYYQKLMNALETIYPVQVIDESNLSEYHHIYQEIDEKALEASGIEVVDEIEE